MKLSAAALLFKSLGLRDTLVVNPPTFFRLSIQLTHKRRSQLTQKYGPCDGAHGTALMVPYCLRVRPAQNYCAPRVSVRRKAWSAFLHHLFFYTKSYTTTIDASPPDKAAKTGHPR